MSDEIQVTLVANAGILLSFRGRKLLIDGLFRAEDTPFSCIPAKTLEKLLNGYPPYDDIDYLLFTHYHPDHFSPEITRSYLERRGAKGVLLPPGHGADLLRLQEELEALQIPCLIAETSGVSEARLAADLQIRTLPTGHLDPKFQDVPHVALLLTLGEKRLLVTGDADYIHETFPALPPLRAVFLNPLFFHACSTGTFFRGSFQTDAFCVYHVPFPEDDVFHLQSMLERDLQQAQRSRPVFVLNQPDQQILL